MLNEKKYIINPIGAQANFLDSDINISSNNYHYIIKGKNVSKRKDNCFETSMQPKHDHIHFQPFIFDPISNSWRIYNFILNPNVVKKWEIVVD